MGLPLIHEGLYHWTVKVNKYFFIVYNLLSVYNLMYIGL